MTSPLTNAILTNVRCVKCGARGVVTCDCWEQCDCGWLRETGGDCANPEHGGQTRKPMTTVAAGKLPVGPDGVLR